MNPILFDFPDCFDSERLTIRCPRPGDGSALNDAVRESLNELRPWMPWADHVPSIDENETYVRRAQAKWLLREDLLLLLFFKGTHTVVGGSGLHRIDWGVPRFEIGYWCRTSLTGHGLITESTNAITAFAFEALNARRVEIRMDDRNERSWRVAERCGFTLEATLRSNTTDVTGHPRDTRIYAKLR
jgi:RimJ/RimL family protein N-acetyltransferase